MHLKMNVLDSPNREVLETLWEYGTITLVIIEAPTCGRLWTKRKTK